MNRDVRTDGAEDTLLLWENQRFVLAEIALLSEQRLNNERKFGILHTLKFV